VRRITLNRRCVVAAIAAAVVAGSVVGVPAVAQASNKSGSYSKVKQKHHDKARPSPATNPYTNQIPAVPDGANLSHQKHWLNHPSSGFRQSTLSNALSQLDNDARPGTVIVAIHHPGKSQKWYRTEVPEKIQWLSVTKRSRTEAGWFGLKARNLYAVEPKVIRNGRFENDPNSERIEYTKSGLNYFKHNAVPGVKHPVVWYKFHNATPTT
jgi:hypothetical protein